MLNIFKSLPVPPPQIKPPAPPENIDNQEGIRKAQREACAIVRSLKPHLEAQALSDSALWKWVKEFAQSHVTFGVDRVPMGHTRRPALCRRER